MSFPLPPEFERAVLDRVRSGQYTSTEEVLAAALRALEHAEAEREALREEVRVDIDRVERSSRGVDGEEALARLRARAAEAASDTGALGRLMDSIRQRCGVPLSGWHREFVDEEVRSGRYASPREVLEAALTVLREAEAGEEDEALAELRREIDLGFESGDSEELIPGEEVEARILARWRGGAR